MLYTIKGGNYYYYHYDGLGSARGITDSSGRIVETYTYDVYGKPTIYNATHTEITESQIGNTYYFTGREFDFSLGLYYYRNRYYNPELGRFMSPDPLGPVDGPNLYTYVGNNPVNYIDPLGLCWGKETVLYIGFESITIAGVVTYITHPGLEIEGAGIYSGSWGFNPDKKDSSYSSTTLYFGNPVPGKVATSESHTYRIPISTDINYIHQVYNNIQSSYYNPSDYVLWGPSHYECYDWTAAMLGGFWY